jgi:hypothetical protein
LGCSGLFIPFTDCIPPFPYFQQAFRVLQLTFASLKNQEMNLVKYLPPSIALFIFALFISRSNSKQAKNGSGARLALIPVCRHCRK